MKPVINTTQRTQKFLELNDYPFHTYVQFGKAKKRKKRPRVVVNPLSGLQNTRAIIIKCRVACPAILW